MERVLAIVFLAGALLISLIVATREPSDREAVGAVVLGLGLATFALAAAAFYYLPAGLRAARRRRGRALRRGAIVGAAVAVLAFLRALDALTALTAAFVLVALAALEGVLSARG